MPRFETPVELPSDPSEDLEAATKQYVDSQAGGAAELSDLTDVDTDGVANNNFLRYSDSAGEWLPVAVSPGSGAEALDDLTDVDVPSVAEGDMLYQNDSGLWVVVSGTKDEGRVPTIQGDGSVAWEAPSGGGGTPPPTTGWSWVNQGSATLAEIGLALSVRSPAVSANNLTARVRSAPSTPYSIFARTVGATLASNGGFGVCFRESGTGKITIAYMKRGGTLVVENWNSATSFSAGVISTATYDAVPIWLRIDDDGTTLTYSVGFLGGHEGVVQIGTQARTVFMDGGPDQVGFAGRDNGQPLSFGLVEWVED